MSERPSLAPDPSSVRRQRDRAATIADSSFLAERTADGLFERLEHIAITPKRALDLGCGRGAMSRRLAGHWKRCRVTGVDWSHRMLRTARSKRSRFSRIREVVAAPGALPFADDCFDAAVANLSLPLLDDPRRGLTDLGRVIRPEGLLLFATLGPDTLKEVREAWHEQDELPHVLPFADMHDMGDALVRAGFRDPVLDVERLTVTYEDVAGLYRDLRAAGAGNTTTGRRGGLTGKTRFRVFEDTLRRRCGGATLAITVELVFGHAWGGRPRAAPGEYHVDPGTIGLRGRPGR